MTDGFGSDRGATTGGAGSDGAQPRGGGNSWRPHETIPVRPPHDVKGDQFNDNNGNPEEALLAHNRFPRGEANKRPTETSARVSEQDYSPVPRPKLRALQTLLG
jgi:hypothetical protein